MKPFRLLMLLLGLSLIGVGGFVAVTSAQSNLPVVIPPTTNTQPPPPTVNGVTLHSQGATVDPLIVSALKSSTDPNAQIASLQAALTKLGGICSQATCQETAALLLNQATTGTSLANSVYQQVGNTIAQQNAQQAANMPVTQQQQNYGGVIHCVNYPVYDYFVNVNGQQVLEGTGTSPTYQGPTILDSNGNPLTVTATFDGGITCPGVQGSIVGSLASPIYGWFTYADAIIGLGAALMVMAVVRDD